jgi:hypothetical protein
MRKTYKENKMKDAKIENVLGLLKEISTVIEDIKENLLKEVDVSVGDVVMKDFSIVKPKEAKDKPEEVFGVVFHVDGSNVRFMALENSEHSLMFKTENTIVSKYLPLYEKPIDTRKDMNGKLNSEIIKNALDFSKEMYPSISYCLDYNRFGFDKGMWYLPSIGELQQIYESKEELNRTLKILGKEEIVSDWYTSSSNSCADWCWWFLMTNSYVDFHLKNSHGWVRPCFVITIVNCN